LRTAKYFLVDGQNITCQLRQIIPHDTDDDQRRCSKDRPDDKKPLALPHLSKL
jgi:hypothetical protein